MRIRHAEIFFLYSATMKTVSFPSFRLTLLASLLCTGVAYGQATTGSGNAVASLNPAIPKLGAVHAQAEGVAASWETSTSAAEIADRQVQNWSDLGRLIPGLDFNRSNSSVNMRGLDGNRVRILEDGIPLPWLNDGSRGVKGGMETINFNTLSSVDVVRGAGAGDAATLTGTVMLRGLRPDDLLADGKDIGLLVKGTHDGLDDSIGGDMAFAARLGASTKMLIQYGISTGSEAQNGGDIGGYGPARTKMNPADYTSKNVGLRLEHELAPGHTLGLGASTFRLDREIDQMHDQNTSTYAIGNNELTERMKRDRIWADYNYKATQAYSALDQAGVQLYWSKTSLEQNQQAIRNKVFDPRSVAIPGNPFRYGYPYGPYERSNSIEQKGWGLNLNAGGYWGDAALRGHWTVAGTFADDTYEQYSAGLDNCPAIPAGLPAPMGPRTCDFLHSNQGDTPKVKSRDWSLFASHGFIWNDGQFELTPALRYDGWSRKPQTGGGFASNQNGYESELRNRSGNQVSPSLEFAWNASDIYRVTARYGYGYRAPTAPELFLQYGSPANYMRKGDPNLKAERSRGWELGFQARGQIVGGSLNIFETRYKDFIDNDVPVGPDSPFYAMMQQGLYPNGVTTYANRDRVRIYGAEAMGYWNINDNLYTRATVAWTVGKDLETGQHLNSVAPLKGTLALGYRAPQWGAETVWTLANKRDKVQYPEAAAGAPNADFQAPGYGTLDVHGWWAPASLKGAKFQLSVVNLFDKKYWNALNVPTAGPAVIARPVDYYSEAGRYVRVSVSYQY